MSAKLKPLDEQVVVLTGACSGVGLCTAQLAAQRGATLVLVARNTRLLQSLMSIIGASGRDAICLAADVTMRDEMTAAARTAAARFGRIDTWINNPGLSIYGRLDQLTEADSRRLFDVNFWGVVNGSLAALPYLLSAGGSLINLGSEVPDEALPLQGMYSSSKHAVKGFTDALRAEVVGEADAAMSITLVQPSEPRPRLAGDVVGPSAINAESPAAALDPNLVAEAILQAATQGGRELNVGQPRAPGLPPNAAAMLPAASPSAKHA